MSCTYFHNEIDSMFDNEPNDLNNDTLLSDKLLWTNDNLSMISNDMTWDSIVDDLSCQNFDPINDKNKDKFLDFDCHLSEFNDFFEEPLKTTIKMEPTHTNSVSSSYLTDDCSPTSSNNNSPVGRKVKKRDFQAIDSSSEKSFALYDDFVEHHPLKSAKMEAVTQPTTKTIYKFSRSSKLEPREPIIINTIPNQRQIVKIRQNSIAAPFIVQRSVKSVNISKYSQEKLTENIINTNTNNNNPSKNNAYYSTQHYDSPVDAQDCDLLNDTFYDDEVDIYDDYKPRVGSYVNVFSNSNSQHNSNSIPNFQTPIPQTGTLYLTDEEKRTLIQENYPIPTRVPLTKQEERNLKKVRRKIKNKLSAQESRRKKKEYVDTLEKKVELYEQREIENKRRIETLENQQRTLQNQIRHYQHQLMNKITGTANTTSTGLMLFMVCFALILVGNSFPSSYRAMNLPQTSLVSRSSLYYMGYGPSRDMLNNSRSIVMASEDVNSKPNRQFDRSLAIDILPRIVGTSFSCTGTAVSYTNNSKTRVTLTTDNDVTKIFNRDILSNKHFSVLGQSILLGGEDSDDKNFEELIMSYHKSKKYVCDNNNKKNNYPIYSPVNSMRLIKNNSYHYSAVHRDMIIARVANIILVK